MAPDATFSNINDKDEFTKFVKFLAYKGIQVIVESRKGVKIEPDTKPQTSGSSWFNLQIPDSPEVNQATKSALPSNRILETIKSRLHVEISVQTEDGDEMVLELWTLELDDTQFDTSLKAMNTVYFRMGILLKSLITITRITPAYHLSRKQKVETFTIFYRIYNGEPNLTGLGESFKKTQAGILKTPLGGLCFTVSYRTNFTMTPDHLQKSKNLLVKSDHFSERSPKRFLFNFTKNKDKEQKLHKPVNLKKPLRHAAFVDDNLVQKVVKDFFDKMPVPVCRSPSSPQTRPEPNPVTDCKSTQELDMSDISKSPIVSSETPPKKFPEFRRENEPPLKLLHFPFAEDHPLRELAEFYKDLFNAPHLKLSHENPEKTKSTDILEEDNKVDDLSKDLALHESSALEFEELLADMCRSAELTGTLSMVVED